TTPIRLLSPIASTISTTIGTNMVAVSKLLAELMMMAPSPEMLVRNSAITMATTARPTARRMPAMMEGSVAGEVVGGGGSGRGGAGEEAGVGRDQRLAHLDQRLRHRGDAEPGVDADREDRHKEDGRDLHLEAEAEPQHQQRHQRDQRHGVARGHVDAERGLGD